MRHLATHIMFTFLLFLMRFSQPGDRAIANINTFAFPCCAGDVHAQFQSSSDRLIVIEDRLWLNGMKSIRCWCNEGLEKQIGIEWMRMINMH